MALSVSCSSVDRLDTLRTTQDDPTLRGAEQLPHSLFIRALVDHLFTSASPPPYDASPPGYEESLDDLPPDYTSTEVLATSTPAKPPLTWHIATNPRRTDIKSPLRIHVDVSDTRNIRTHAGKKAKQAAKKANQAKWADSGDEGEGSKDGGDGSKDGGGDGGSAGGGAGGDGGGGDDGWDDAPKKGKKDKKKNKKAGEEEEEEENADGGNFWDNLGDGAGGGAGDANPVDEWGDVGTGKKNKKKGKKVRGTLDGMYW